MLPVLMIASFTLFPVVLLPIGALGTIVGILYLIGHSADLLGIPPGRVLSLIFVLLAGSTAVVFAFSGARWALNAVDGLAPLRGWSWSPSVLALRLLNEPYRLMPGLILLLFLAWPLRLLLGAYRRSHRKYHARLRLSFAAPISPGTDWMTSSRIPLLAMLASLAGSLFVGAYPYLHTINPKSTHFIGYDVNIFYYHFLHHMLGLSPLSAVGYSLKNARAGFLILQYALALLTGSAGLAIRVVPAILGVLLAITTYFFVKTGSGDRVLAGTAALFAAFSFQVVSGINAGFDADWLAMCEVLVFLSLLIVALNRQDRRYVYLSVVASVLILFTHPWTWLVILGVVVTYSLFTLVQASMNGDLSSLRFELTTVVSILAIDVAIDVVKGLLGSSSGVQDVSSGSATSLSLANIPTVLGSLHLTLQTFLGGALDNSVIIVFAIVGVIALPDLQQRMNRLLLSWMAVASVGLLVYGFSTDFLQARVILLAPLQVLAAVGFLSVVRYLTSLMSAGGYENQRQVKVFVALAYISVFGVLLGYALQNVGFLYTGY